MPWRKQRNVSRRWLILIGFVAGLIAKLVTADRRVGGFIMTTVLGIIGSVVGPSPYPRMVRDLSHALNRKVQLEMEGQDTELDRACSKPSRIR